MQAIVGDLTSGFTPALLDRKPDDWAHAISRVAQRLQRFGQPKTQRADHPCGHNCHARSDLFAVRAAWFTHDWTDELLRDFYCFPIRTILQVSRNGNGSPEVGGLSVEFIQ